MHYHRRVKRESTTPVVSVWLSPLHAYACEETKVLILRESIAKSANGTRLCFLFSFWNSALTNGCETCSESNYLHALKIRARNVDEYVASQKKEKSWKGILPGPWLYLRHNWARRETSNEKGKRPQDSSLPRPYESRDVPKKKTYILFPHTKKNLRRSLRHYLLRFDSSHKIYCKIKKKSSEPSTWHRLPPVHQTRSAPVLLEN
jgi:hypothetical protein